MPQSGVHHSAICTGDVEAALRFWQDGMGLEQLFDLSFTGDWQQLFGAATDQLRSIFLGDPRSPGTGIVELVVFDGVSSPQPDSPASTGPPPAGFFLLSFERDVDAQLARLTELGFAADVRRIAQPVGDGRSVDMAVLTAPDGVAVELVGSPA
jgi:catechol 2,3-dioxygenase-like lactoylglutathione lyase family enzyme